MENTQFYFMNASRGTSEKGEFYRISLAIYAESNGKSVNFSLDFFVDAVMFAKVSDLKRFQEVDCVFLPTSTGKARLASIEAL